MDDDNEDSVESQKIELDEVDTIELRRWAIEKALISVKVFEDLDFENGEDYGDALVAIADKIENYILEGKKEDQ